jgi:metalloprotein, YbeY/UPF0054 family
MLYIEVSNLNKRHPINEKFVGEIARSVLKSLKKDKIELEIIFLSDAAIRPVNVKYKGSDRATDVLSFDLGSCKEILISSDMALRNSRIFNTPLEKELVLYVIHGILHLFGYLSRFIHSCFFHFFQLELIIKNLVTIKGQR